MVQPPNLMKTKTTVLPQFSQPSTTNNVKPHLSQMWWLGMISTD